MSDRDLAARLVQARNALKLTQDALSGASGIPLSTLKKYEGSHREPGAEALGRLVKAGLNANWLLTGEGDMRVDTVPARNAEPTAKNAVEAAEAVDSLLLQEVIDFFYAWLAARDGEVKIARSAHGAVISVLYRIALQSGGVKPEEMEQVLKLAA